MASHAGVRRRARLPGRTSKIARRSWPIVNGRSFVCGEGQMSKTHDYEKHAGEYAELGMEGKQYLAFRDIPMLIREYAGAIASVLDYGCGAGRSTRFLKRLGFNAVGVDVSQEMLEQARSKDG